VELVTFGSGPPLVFIPRLEGRWEYMRPAIEALARSHRVLTFSLAGERSSGIRLERSRGLENYVDQVAAALDREGISSAAICGVSFGGVVAIRFAAAMPDRTTALVLASVPGPTFHLKRRHVLYSRAPWIFGPLFVAETPWRLRAEMTAAFPRGSARLRFAFEQLRVFTRAPVSLARMAERARMIATLDLRAECAQIAAPTLVVTGERLLDHIVSVDGSSEYVRLIPGARGVVLDRTGHQGVMTRPDAFADLVRTFLKNPRHAAA
jgi:3-oxoadipate enol-lactonase